MTGSYAGAVPRISEAPRHHASCRSRSSGVAIARPSLMMSDCAERSGEDVVGIEREVEIFLDKAGGRQLQELLKDPALISGEPGQNIGMAVEPEIEPEGPEPRLDLIQLMLRGDDVDRPGLAGRKVPLQGVGEDARPLQVAEEPAGRSDARW